MTNNSVHMTFPFSPANETRIKEGSQKAAWVLIVKLLRPEHHLGYSLKAMWDDDGYGDDDNNDEDSDDND